VKASSKKSRINAIDANKGDKLYATVTFTQRNAPMSLTIFTPSHPALQVQKPYILRSFPQFDVSRRVSRIAVLPFAKVIQNKIRRFV